jgi:uncharacterized PurR-regulated membrane protein YhhQ (DUF165 family)
MRPGGTAAWSGPYFGYRDTTWHRIVDASVMVGRMILPVGLLLFALFEMQENAGTTVAYFPGTDGRFWLSGSHLLLPLAFFAVHLTNRRYGPAYALAQAVLGLAALFFIDLYANNGADPAIQTVAIPSLRLAVAFAVAFFAAGFVSIIAFDGARGPYWWSAPLVGFLCAAIFFPLFFFPAAYAGLGDPWIGEGLTYMGILAGEGIALLFPYYLLRRIVPPLSGFGGF